MIERQTSVSTKKELSVSGLILAGGRGSRVAGRDKGLVKFRGKRLVESQIEWMRPQVSEILISANRNLACYEKLGYCVLKDLHDGFSGPMEGILQGLYHAENDWLFVLPVDVPFLPDNLIEKITSTVDPNFPVYYLASAQREHYLLMFINRNQLAAVENFINSGKKRIRDFLAKVKGVRLELGLDEAVFANLNQSDDFREGQAK